MKFWRDVVVFAVVFFATFVGVTLLMNGFDFDKVEFDTAICYTIGGTIGWGLVSYFKGKKKENK